MPKSIAAQMVKVIGQPRCDERRPDMPFECEAENLRAEFVAVPCAVAQAHGVQVPEGAGVGDMAENLANLVEQPQSD